MSAIKCTLFIRMTTGGSEANEPPASRLGGWTESYYLASGDMATAKTLVLEAGQAKSESLTARRAALLPESATIYQVRFQQVDPLLPSKIEYCNVKGKAGFGDQPSMSLMCDVTTGTLNQGRLYLRGLPQARNIRGEYAPSADYRNALIRFSQRLNSFSIWVRDKTQTTVAVVSISDTGLLRAEASPGITANQPCRVLTTVDECGRRRGGRFIVSAVTDAGLTLQLLGWPYGATKGGKVRKDAKTFAQIAFITNNRIVSRKVGRPFADFRGRRSNRR